MLALAVGACAPSDDPTGRSSSDLDHLGRPVRRYFEIYVPPGVSPVELREEHGIGLWPSDASHDEVEGSWWVALYDGFQPNGKIEVQIREGAGPWTTLRTHPASRLGAQVHGDYPDEEPDDSTGTALRTENIDLPPSFDQSNGLQVRFVATWTQNPPAQHGTFVFRVYDVKLVGRHVP